MAEEVEVVELDVAVDELVALVVATLGDDEVDVVVLVVDDVEGEVVVLVVLVELLLAVDDADVLVGAVVVLVVVVVVVEVVVEVRGAKFAVSVTGLLIVIEAGLLAPVYEPAPEPVQPTNCHPAPGVAEIDTIALELYQPPLGETAPPLEGAARMLIAN